LSIKPSSLSKIIANQKIFLLRQYWQRNHPVSLLGGAGKAPIGPATPGLSAFPC
jgi:hypothetical protein